jgi:hypothetical protein
MDGINKLTPETIKKLEVDNTAILNSIFTLAGLTMDKIITDKSGIIGLDPKMSLTDKIDLVNDGIATSIADRFVNGRSDQ